MVHSSVELKTDSQGAFSCPALLKYLYSGINWVAVILTELNGKLLPSRAFLGISGAEVDNGIKITNIIPDTSAEKSGLNAEDIITEFDGMKMTEMIALREAIRQHVSGDEVKVKFIRDEDETEFTIQLGSNPEESKEPGRKYAFDRLLKEGEKESSREAKVRDATLRLFFSTAKPE